MVLKKCSNFILLYLVVFIFSCHILKKLSFLHYILLPPLSKIRCPYVCRFISGLSVLLHYYISFSVQYHTVLITVALYSLKSGSLILPTLFLFLKNALAIEGLLYFHTNFKIFVLVLWKMPLVI